MFRLYICEIVFYLHILVLKNEIMSLKVTRTVVIGNAYLTAIWTKGVSCALANKKRCKGK